MRDAEEDVAGREEPVAEALGLCEGRKTLHLERRGDNVEDPGQEG